MACKYTYKGTTYNSKEEFISQIINPQFLSNQKIRRVVELQSDLFQKGRDKANLVKGDLAKEFSPVEIINEDDRYRVVFENTDEDVRSSFSNKQEAEKYVQIYNKQKESTENEFLQLLNKDNNWVTFFIKSIIQDSAKKGYEKVLFPSGSTASKVEGHTTLEEFKKQKEDRIKKIEESNNILQKELDAGFSYNEDNGKNRKDYKNSIVANNKEISQLKQELERVETEGFGALKPIYNFYENIVTSILKKRGYNPVNITDEYGNTWNEVTINPTKDLANILFQRIDSAEEQKTTQTYETGEPTKEVFDEITRVNAIRERYFPNGKEAKSHEILDKIIESNHIFSQIASEIKKGVSDDSTVKLLTREEAALFNESFAGLYDVGWQQSYVVDMDLTIRGSSSPEALLIHELIHELTSHYIRGASNAELENFKKLYNHVLANKDKIRDDYPLTNLDEFIAGIFTNSTFMNDLKKMQPMDDLFDGNNLLEQFLNIILSLLKADPSVRTLYHQAFEEATTVLQKGINYTKDNANRKASNEYSTIGYKNKDGNNQVVYMNESTVIKQYMGVDNYASTKPSTRNENIMIFNFKNNSNILHFNNELDLMNYSKMDYNMPPLMEINIKLNELKKEKKYDAVRVGDEFIIFNKDSLTSVLPQTEEVNPPTISDTTNKITPSQLSKKIGAQKIETQDRIMYLRKKLKEYNRENNTSHELIYEPVSPHAGNVTFRINDTPSIKTTTAVAQQTINKFNGKRIEHSIIANVKDFSGKNIGEYVYNGEVYATLEEAVREAEQDGTLIRECK